MRKAVTKMVAAFFVVPDLAENDYVDSFRLEPRSTFVRVLRPFLKPPVVEVDSLTITCLSNSAHVVVPRSELSMIFKGQVVQHARYTAWVQSYLYFIADGTAAFSVPAFWFRDEDVSAFAHRIQIPLRGDFSQPVTVVAR